MLRKLFWLPSFGVDLTKIVIKLLAILIRFRIKMITIATEKRDEFRMETLCNAMSELYGFKALMKQHRYW
jgi:hypothetical protein